MYNTLEENHKQKVLYILSKLENSDHVFDLKEKEIEHLLQIYELNTKEFMENIKKL